jgi:hypothetical protein
MMGLIIDEKRGRWPVVERKHPVYSLLSWIFQEQHRMINIIKSGLGSHIRKPRVAGASTYERECPSDVSILTPAIGLNE